MVMVRRRQQSDICDSVSTFSSEGDSSLTLFISVAFMVKAVLFSYRVDDSTLPGC